MSDCAVFCSKIGIATQRQRECAFLLAQVDKSRETAIDKSRDLSRAAPATPSSAECTHCLLQRSLMKQVNVPLCSSTLSPIFDQPESITKLPPTVSDVALPPAVEDVALPPTVEQVARGGQHEVGGGSGGKIPWESIPLGDSLIVNQDTAHPQPRKPPMGRHLTTITIPIIVAQHSGCVNLCVTRHRNS